jgi:hypothetical protein
MRSLIDVEFIDNTNYSDNSVSDILGAVLPHYWGPVDEINQLSYSEFVASYPAIVTENWATIASAYFAGAGLIEIVRPRGLATFYHGVLYKPKVAVTGKPLVSGYDRQAGKVAGVYTGDGPYVKDAEVDVTFLDIRLRYPGNAPSGNQLVVTLSNLGTTPEIKIAYNVSSNGITVELESHEGSLVPGTFQDGKKYFISDVLSRDSSFLELNLLQDVDHFVEIYTGSGLMTAVFTIPVDAEDYDYQLTAADVADAYVKYFASTKISQATLLFSSKPEELTNKAILDIAEARMDCNALLGHSIALPLTEAGVTAEYIKYQGKFGNYYAGRDYFLVNGVKVPTTCIGRVAGRYCNVTKNAGINQVPSAKAFGAYPGVLTESLSEDEVVALHKLGVNSVYQTMDGPYIWGIKSLFERQTSFYSKANIMRVCAFVLASTFDLLEEILHTPNTDAKKKLVQDDRQTAIDSLVASNALKADSTAVCNSTNNTDAETAGGELLILDLDLGFIKLIERFKVRVVATDSTVSATLINS